MTTCPARFMTAKELKITGNQEIFVYECLLRGGWYSLGDIRTYLSSKGYMARETSISARIRDINKKLRLNNMAEISWKYKKKGSTDTLYSLGEIQ